MRAAHDERDLRDPERGHPRLVVEDPPEVVAVRKDVRLQWQERTARVDEIDARQPVLERDLLRPQVLLHGHRVVGAALDRGVVGDDDAGRALDPADAGDHPGSRRLVVVHAVRGERAQLEERRPGIEKAIDAVADRQLAAFPVAGDGPLVAAGAAVGEGRLARPKLGDELGHDGLVGASLLAGRVEPAAQDGHGHDDRNREPSPPVIGDDVERASPARGALLAAGCALVQAPAAGPLVTVEATGGHCPRERAGASSPSKRTGASTSVEPAEMAIHQVDRRVDRSSCGPRSAITDFEAIRSRPFLGTCPTAFDGQELVYTVDDGARPGADRVVRRRGRPAGAAVHGDPRDPRRQPARAGALAGLVGHRSVLLSHSTL